MAKHPDDQPDFDIEGHRLEARIISQYILASDNVLREELRKKLTEVIHDSVRDVWNEQTTTQHFREQLSSHLIEQTRKVVAHSEYQTLYHKLKDKIADSWQQTMRRATQDGVKEFLDQKVDVAISKRGSETVTKAADQVDVAMVFENAAQSAIEKHVEKALREHLLGALKDQLTEKSLSQIAADVIRERFNKWGVSLVALLFLLPLLLTSFLFLEHSRSKKVTQELTAQLERLAPPKEIANNGDAVSGAGKDSGQEQSGASLGSEPSHVLKDKFQEVFEHSESSDASFKHLAQAAGTFYSLFFGFLPESILIKKVEKTKKQSETRIAIFNESRIETFETSKDKVAAFVLQTLALFYAEQKVKEPKWFTPLTNTKTPQEYIDGFTCDGDAGGKTKKLSRTILADIGEKPEDFFNGNQNPKANESLLIAHLILKSLTAP